MTFRMPFPETPALPLREDYLAAGAVCSISTNSEAILAAARKIFSRLDESPIRADVRMRLWVDAEAQSGPPWPRPYFRGMGHLVFAAFDTENTILADLRGRRVIGRISPGMAADLTYWARVVFPAFVGIVSGAIGLTALHCACVARDGSGLLLAGGSGSGKSTLSLALARNGFAFLSDDWTYFSRREDQLVAWGLTSPLKLLPDAVEHFPELAGFQPGVSSNGEVAYEIDPEEALGLRRSPCVEPRWLVFLERREGAGIDLIGVRPAEAAARLERDLEDLPDVVSGTREYLLGTIESLVRRPCWLLRYGETPQAVAQAISRFCENGTASASLK
jgi:hypothetical protein